MEVLSGLGFVVIILALLKLFASNLIKSLFERDLESHKAQLRLAAEREMAQIRANNEVLLAEYKEKISHLSRERTDAIKGVSHRLIEMWSSVEAIAAILKTRSSTESREDASIREFDRLHKAVREFWEFYQQADIFFPTDLSERILEFQKKVDILGSTWGPIMSHFLLPEQLGEQEKNIREVRDEIEPEFQAIRVAFRQLLGVDAT